MGAEAGAGADPPPGPESLQLSFSLRNIEYQLCGRSCLDPGHGGKPNRNPGLLELGRGEGGEPWGVFRRKLCFGDKGVEDNLVEGTGGGWGGQR